MLSTRGAITTNVAMLECARGQNASNKEVFLLSELEKVWVSVSVIVRRLLIEGKNVRIDNFGSFWTENRLGVTDPIYHMRYYVRRLCFGINTKFANRYGIDDYKVPLEKTNRGFSKIDTADVVRLCAVPAHTVSMALREFFMYIGEGLHCGRVFSLYFPGVATVVLKKERMMLTVDPELQDELFELDSRRWPAEKRLAGRQLLEADKRRSAGSASAASSRPCTQPASRASWRSGGSHADERPVFIAAAPTGRLFSEIERDAQRRLRAFQEGGEPQEPWQQRRHASNCAKLHSEVDEAAWYEEVQNRLDHAETETYCPTATTRESVYDIVQKEPCSVEEPEIEAIEEVRIDNPPAPGAAAADGRFLRLKNTELEAILIKEEPFSRPISRRTFHDPSSARDLIYDGAKMAGTRLNEPEMHYGRKRFDNNIHDVDRVGSLLKGVS